MFRELYSAVENVAIKCLQNEMLDESQRSEITQLFMSEYYDYHYLSDFFSENKIHFLAFYEGVLIGYAGIQLKAKVAYFANLLVSKKFRNLFIGKKLEAYRINYCSEKNLISYSSCVMDSIHSQILKYSNCMIPINLKYGYRSDVLYKGHLGGAVTFLHKQAKILPVRLESLIVDQRTMRMRLVTSNLDALLNFLNEVRDNDDWYIDLVSSENAILSYAGSSDRWSYQGHDICNGILEGGVLYQLKNDRFRRGINTKNRILFSPSDICGFIKVSQ